MLRLNIYSSYRKSKKTFGLKPTEIWATVIRNLVSNAIKYSPIGNGVVKVIAKTEDDFISIQVIDNGMGMDEIFMASIFRSDSHHSQKERVMKEDRFRFRLMLPVCKYE